MTDKKVMDALKEIEFEDGMIIPVYWGITDGKAHLDTEGMRDMFNDKIKELEEEFDELNGGRKTRKWIQVIRDITTEQMEESDDGEQWRIELWETEYLGDDKVEDEYLDLIQSSESKEQAVKIAEELGKERDIIVYVSEATC